MPHAHCPERMNEDEEPQIDQTQEKVTPDNQKLRWGVLPHPPPAEENKKFSTHYARNTPQKSPPDEENHKETLQATKLLRGGVLPQPKDENIVKKIRTLGESPPHPSNPKNKNLQKKNPREIFKNLVKEEFTPKKLQKRRTLTPRPKISPQITPPPHKREKL